MKRLLSILTLVALSLGFAMTAQANVLENDNWFSGRFGGHEVVFSKDGERITDPGLLAQSGLDMYAIAIIESIKQTRPGPTGLPQAPDLFQAGTGGSYFTTLTGFKSAEVVFTNEARTEFEIYFTGGLLSWYYSQDSSLTNILTNMVYSDEHGDFLAEDGVTTFESLKTEPFMVAELYAGEIHNEQAYTAKVGGKIDAAGGLTITTDFNAYAKVLPEYNEWQSGAYANSTDIVFGAQLRWDQATTEFGLDSGHFRVNNPTPEPGTIALMGLGLLGLAAAARRRRSN